MSLGRIFRYIDYIFSPQFQCRSLFGAKPLLEEEELSYTMVTPTSQFFTVFSQSWPHALMNTASTLSKPNQSVLNSHGDCVKSLN